MNKTLIAIGIIIILIVAGALLYKPGAISSPQTTIVNSNQGASSQQLSNYSQLLNVTPGNDYNMFSQSNLSYNAS